MKSKKEQEFHFDEDENLDINNHPSSEEVNSTTSKRTDSNNAQSNHPEDTKGRKEKTSQESKKKKRTSLKKRIEELEQLVSQYEEEIKDLTDKNLRLHAEFDNFRKRQERELERTLKYAGEDIILDLVGIVDDLERTLKAIDQAESSNQDSTSTIKTGIEMIHNKIMKTLERWDVHPIEAVGQPFDPDLHEAMMTQESDGEVEPNTVIEEFEKGYTFKDKVLRHSKVIVSR